MLYGKRRFPLWAKVAGLVLVVIVGFLTGYAGYTLYRDLTAPPLKCRRSRARPTCRHRPGSCLNIP